MKQLLVMTIIFFSTLNAFGEESKKTVCLNMIVKNEKEVITRCLESVLPLIDTWVIVDTGSTDGTQEIIKKFLKDVPGTLYERPWVDFGYNRNEALNLAKTTADYLLFVDADDKLVFSNDFIKPKLTQDFYAISTHSGSDISWFVRLAKSDLNWFWNGAIHETLDCKDSANGSAMEGVEYVYLHDGARAHDPKTPQKDFDLLQEATLRDPENPRNFFYLAKMHLVLGNLEKALETFEKRSQMNGFEEEIFLSKLAIGQIQNLLKRDSKVVQESFLNAFLYRPHRPEALYYLIEKLQIEKEYEKGYEIALQALDLSKNNNDTLFVEKWISDFGLLMQYTLCAAHTGHYAEGLTACKTLLSRNDLPEAPRNEVLKYQEYIQQAVRKQIQDKLEALIK